MALYCAPLRSISWLALAETQALHVHKAQTFSFLDVQLLWWLITDDDLHWAFLNYLSGQTYRPNSCPQSSSLFPHPPMPPSTRCQMPGVLVLYNSARKKGLKISVTGYCYAQSVLLPFVEVKKLWAAGKTTLPGLQQDSGHVPSTSVLLTKTSFW